MQCRVPKSFASFELSLSCRRELRGKGRVKRFLKNDHAPYHTSLTPLVPCCVNAGGPDGAGKASPPEAQITPCASSTFMADALEVFRLSIRFGGSAAA